MLMALHPDVQKRAQAEVDDEVGRNQVAEYAQLENVPYLFAVMKEVLRFAPVGPLGVFSPHCTTDTHSSLPQWKPSHTRSCKMTNIWDTELQRIQRCFPTSGIHVFSIPQNDLILNAHCAQGDYARPSVLSRTLRIQPGSFLAYEC